MENSRLALRALLVLFVLTFPVFAWANPENGRWQRQARDVTITRDDWGIAHVVGKTDADAVFGMIYAQAEDDFNRIETNYLNSLGRLAEAEGEGAIWSDLRQRLFMNEDELKKDYERSPTSLKELMNAWADGLNYYLSTHPQTKPRVITRFEPWMPLSFSEGSIGGDIETINIARLREFYGGAKATAMELTEYDTSLEPTGSNGIAIAPQLTRNKNALLLINPHTSFFFRSELQMTSGEGLNAYGAATWGQFFIYQGFNDRLGWMHTSGSVDAIDHFNETVIKRGDSYVYEFGRERRPITTKAVTLKHKTPTGMGSRTFATYRTHHGPVIAEVDGKWQTVSLMHKPVEALMQSYGRTRAKNFDEFKKVMELNANSSNNTLYADADGNIAYFHVNYVPRRDSRFDWSKPVDGSNPAADHKGTHTFAELPNLRNPATGWVFNTNNNPWSAAGSASLKAASYPRYVDVGTENARGLHAIRLLENKRDFTLEKLLAAAYDSYLPWFEKTVPALVSSWDKLPAGDARRARLADQIAVLKSWDTRWAADSVATSLAVFWAEDLVRKISTESRRMQITNEAYVAQHASPEQLLMSLTAASDRLTSDFGKWRTPWGEINRFQRLTGDIVHPFDDAAPSIPVAFTSGNWGSLASFGAAPRNGTKKYYGTSGNSFVAVVEFGKQVKAKAVTAGGESGDPRSKHFNDQATRYATGNLRDVYFYPSQLKGHTERVYRPGN
ncbi:MAG: penicillin acylase family protein [Pyrinomonadaceae bacterium]